MTCTRCHATTEIMQSESAPATVAILDVETLDIASLGQSNLAKDSLGKNSLGKDSLGKDSLGKDSLGNDRLGNDSLAKDSLGKDSLGHSSLGKENAQDKGHDKDKDDETAFDAGVTSSRRAITLSRPSMMSVLTGSLAGNWADFWAGIASIGRVDGIVNGVVLGIDDSTVAGGAKSSTTPITMDELYDGDTTPVLLWKRSMTRRRWRWFRSASESW
ncbi:MAG: hypothetical protein WB566_18595 [Terriglobales bacterium]